MKTALAVTAVLLSFVAATQAACAETLVVGPDGVLAAARSIAAPESPAAAFERMLVARAPASAAAAPARVDPLEAPFHAALWSAPKTSKLASAGAHVAERRQ